MLKNVKKLLSSAKERRLQGVFVIEGLRLVREAAPEICEQLFISESLAKAGEFDTSLYKNAILQKLCRFEGFALSHVYNK